MSFNIQNREREREKTDRQRLRKMVSQNKLRYKHRTVALKWLKSFNAKTQNDIEKEEDKIGR